MRLTDNEIRAPRPAFILFIAILAINSTMFMKILNVRFHLILKSPMLAKHRNWVSDRMDRLLVVWARDRIWCWI